MARRTGSVNNRAGVGGGRNPVLGQRERTRGRPSVWDDPATEALLLSSFQNVGAHVRIACAAAGINEKTYYDRVSVDPDFAERAAAAREKGAHRALEQMAKAGAHDWRAAEAWLKLTHPASFAQRVEVTEEVMLRLRLEVMREFVGRLAQAGLPPDVRRAVALQLVSSDPPRLGDGGAGSPGASGEELAG